MANLLYRYRRSRTLSILGHGSWARDTKYVALLVEQLEEAGYDEQESTALDDNVIPSHSYLFGAWVEAGVAGGLFWMYVLWLGMAAVYRTLKKTAEAHTPLIMFTMVFLTWNVLFSPFGQEHRVVAALQICFALWVLRSSQRVAFSRSKATAGALVIHPH